MFFFSCVNAFVYESNHVYKSPCHNSLEPITSIITIIREIVLTFMYQLAQLKQVIELLATGGYTFGITVHKKLI